MEGMVGLCLGQLCRCERVRCVALYLLVYGKERCMD